MSDGVYIGQLDHRAAIYEYQNTKTSTGEDAQVEVPYKNAWCKIDDAGAKEVEDGKISLYAVRKYTIRYDENIMQRGEEMFIKETDGDYRVTSIQLIGRKNYMVLKTLKRE